MTTSTEATTALDRPRFFIGGEWTSPQGSETYTLLEASTGNVLGTAALGSPLDVDSAVKAAHRALHGPWGSTTAAERSSALRRVADALEKRGDATAQLVSRENGMPITLSNSFNAAGPPAVMRMYADLLDQTELEEVRPSPNGATIVRREPVGVVAAIVPWNYPQPLAVFKLAPALAAGCTIVLKPSPETALDAYAFAEAAAEAGLPAGVLNVVPADRGAGATLVEHPLVDKVAFTGSTVAGKAIAAKCAEQVKRVTLELGGKSAAIVLDDVDIDVLLRGIGSASFANNSQTCTTQARILAPRSRYDEVVDAIADFSRDMRIGNALDPETTLGPMATETHLNRVLRYIEIGKQSDARLIAGGNRPAATEGGWFVEPTVFADVRNSDTLAREEIFGPVMTIIPYDGDEEAIRIANDSEFGLGGSVWTADEERGINVARRVRTGTIGVNYYDTDLNAPFGGMKQSGIGRELGPEGLAGYLEYKSMYVSADQIPSERT